MFNLLDRVADGIQPMLNALEDYIITAGLADMKASADTITIVSTTYILIEGCSSVSLQFIWSDSFY